MGGGRGGAARRPAAGARGRDLLRRDGIGLHLLAYLFDPAHEQLAAEMAMALDDRVPRAKAIVAKMAEAGQPITWDLVLAQLQDGATSAARTSPTRWSPSGWCATAPRRSGRC